MHTTRPVSANVLLSTGSATPGTSPTLSGQPTGAQGEVALSGRSADSRRTATWGGNGLVLPINVALVSEVDGHDPSDVARVAAALQKQAARDFGPIWQVHASVDAFPRLKDVPVGYWPMIVRTDIDTPGAAGVHEDRNGRPFALIQMSDSWSLTASHEMLEMLGDPFGKRTIPGKSPKRGQGRVEFLVEVCDPSEAEAFAYTVNDILVSDFYAPRFFDPRRVEGVRSSFPGAIPPPREVLRGGYLSWHEPVSDHWWQQVWFGARKQYRDLGVFDASARNVRAWVDAQTDHPGIDAGLPKSSPVLKQAVAAGDETLAASTGLNDLLREQIDTLVS